MFEYVGSKVMWVGRATTFCVGLVVVFSVVLGVGTTALAAVPGDPFKLGRANVVDRASGLFGKAAGALFVIDNNGTGPALDLRVGASTTPAAGETVAPMRVDSQAKVVNLNSDELDGMSADGFYASGSTVADAERLDGADSADFMRYFSRYVTARSEEDSLDKKTVAASCPAGEVALSGRATVNTQRISHNPIDLPVALQSAGPLGARWSATARETEAYDGDWNLQVTAYCVQAPPEIVPLDEGRK